MLPSKTMIWQPEFTDKTLSRKTGAVHRTWLANQSFSQPSQQIAFQHYCQSLEQIEDRILQLDQEIPRLLPEWSLCNLVCQLQALKGVGQLTAITLVAELGDFSRFSNPKQLMAFLGLVLSEYSSGNSIRPRGITKVGNSELRRLLYEAAWSYRTPAKVGAWLIYYRTYEQYLRQASLLAANDCIADAIEKLPAYSAIFI